MAEEEEEEDLQRPPAKRAASRLSSSSRASPSTRKRKTRDPTKPKPARTGYVIFLVSRRTRQASERDEQGSAHDRLQKRGHKEHMGRAFHGLEARKGSERSRANSFSGTHS